MLFDVAAIALTSGALGGVTEAFVVHENSQFQSSITALFDPVSNVLTSDPTDASPLALAAPVNPSMLPKLSGSALLDQLTLIPSSKIARYMAGNPAAVSRMLVDPPMAASVTSWWSGLSSATKRSLSASAPELIGNLDGLPFATRDAANRSYLAKSLAETRATLSQGAGRGSLVDERRKYEVLLQVNRALVTAPGKPIRQLLTFDPEGEGRAAIAVGDLATADYVSYMVPGMFFTLQGQMADWTTIAQNLYNEQASWLTRLDKLDSTHAGKSAATVAWIGYATPGVLDVASLDRANQGAQFLGNAIQGIKAA
ncbi:MAG: putative secreted protein, partial [Microbacteriaceae bacterium]|nr:putative secreted protein [Microbacteriaceae bacterium]